MGHGTIMYSPCWIPSLEAKDNVGSNWLERIQRYLEYYRPLKERLGFDGFWFSDNASPRGMLSHIDATDIYFRRFRKELVRGYEKPNDYPYCWRAFYYVGRIMQCPTIDKIIICDTDSFILSRKMADYIRETNTGYYTFWSPTCLQPTSEISVICRDAFPMLLNWMSEKTWKERSNEGKCFEKEVPATVIKTFVGDRYGEKAHYHEDVQQGPGMDFYTQAPVRIPLTFGLEP